MCPCPPCFHRLWLWSFHVMRHPCCFTICAFWALHSSAVCLGIGWEECKRERKLPCRDFLWSAVIPSQHLLCFLWFVCVCLCVRVIRTYSGVLTMFRGAYWIPEIKPGSVTSRNSVLSAALLFRHPQNLHRRLTFQMMRLQMIIG